MRSQLISLLGYTPLHLRDFVDEPFTDWNHYATGARKYRHKQGASAPKVESTASSISSIVATFLSPCWRKLYSHYTRLLQVICSNSVYELTAPATFHDSMKGATCRQSRVFSVHYSVQDNNYFIQFPLSYNDSSTD